MKPTVSPQSARKAARSQESVRNLCSFEDPTADTTCEETSPCELFYVLPVLYGPYFVHEAQSYSGGLLYVMPVLFSVIFVGLDNIQDHLENPFDQIGEDDVAINAEKFADRLTLEAVGDDSTPDRTEIVA